MPLEHLHQKSRSALPIPGGHAVTAWSAVPAQTFGCRLPSRFEALEHRPSTGRVGPQVVLGLQHTQTPGSNTSQEWLGQIGLFDQGSVFRVLRLGRQPMGETLGQVRQPFGPWRRVAQTAYPTRSRVVGNDGLYARVTNCRHQCRFAPTRMSEYPHLWLGQHLVQGCNAVCHTPSPDSDRRPWCVWPMVMNRTTTLRIGCIPGQSSPIKPGQSHALAQHRLHGTAVDHMRPTAVRTEQCRGRVRCQGLSTVQHPRHPSGVAHTQLPNAHALAIVLPLVGQHRMARIVLGRQWPKQCVEGCQVGWPMR